MSSYRLESPRPSPSPRNTLPPLRIRSSVYTPSSVSPTTLLYDLPLSTSRSPPPQLPDPLPTPLSSSPSPSRQRTRPTPPHSRSATPAPALARQELDQFAAHCHAWYFDQDHRAGQLITQTIEALPAAQRAPYTRLQASIRSAYHTAMSKRRKSEFRAHLSSIHPGCSLLPHTRANPHGKAATNERRDKFARFLRTWCTLGMPGTRPFFQALWALFRLQLLPVNLGGAGSKRIQWELDDAVFQESAGKEFMLEAIDVLKGVLAFEEYLPPRISPPLDELQTPTPVPASPPIPTLSPPTRPHSLSDPFLDTPAPPHSLTTSTSASRASNTPLSQSASHDLIPPPSPGIRTQTPYKDTKTAGDDRDERDSVDEQPYMRLWTAPDLTNPELQSLIALFPDFITRQSVPRFAVATAVDVASPDPLAPDLEEGMIAEDPREVRCGTGRLWVGEKERSEGWRGSWWHRFIGWWRRLFC